MNALIVCLFLVASVSAVTVTSKVELPPHWYRRIYLKDINGFSFKATDDNGFGVTAYLNAGLVEYFDPPNSLIKCLNIETCSVQDLSLDSGSYTLFIYNNYYLFNQQIEYTLIYTTVFDDIIYYITFLGTIFGIPIVMFGSLFVVIWCCRRFYLLGVNRVEYTASPQEIQLEVRG